MIYYRCDWVVDETSIPLLHKLFPEYVDNLYGCRMIMDTDEKNLRNAGGFHIQPLVFQLVRLSELDRLQQVTHTFHEDSIWYQISKYEYEQGHPLKKFGITTVLIDTLYNLAEFNNNKRLGLA